MPDRLVIIFHLPPLDGDPPLSRTLAEARDALVEHHIAMFNRAGADRVMALPGRDPTGPRRESFGERLARLVRDEHVSGGLVVLGDGAVPLLRPSDAGRLLETAGSSRREALTNNRYSSDVCAIADARALLTLAPLPTDNALPRWLEERAGYVVRELAGRDRLALDVDTPLDVALVALARGAPPTIRRVARAHGLKVPHLDALRELAADPRRELLVAGRSGSRTLRWLERNVRCRVRFLAEERELRTSSPLAIGPPTAQTTALRARPPRSSLGRLLHALGPGALGEIVAELADGALIDTRVLLADRLGADEGAWPSPEDRYASDLLRATGIADPWLHDLTASVARAALPIVLGGHTLVSPGVPLILGARRPGRATTLR